jgi:hypothetical protein
MFEINSTVLIVIALTALVLGLPFLWRGPK